MSAAHTTAAPVSPCPPWCDPTQCRDVHAIMWHRGTPVTVKSGGVTVVLALGRNDEAAHPHEWDHAPWVDCTITSKIYAEEGSEGRTPLSVTTDFSIREAADLSLCLAEFHTQADNPGAKSVEAFTVAGIVGSDGERSYCITGRKSAKSGDAVRVLRALLAILDEQESSGDERPVWTESQVDAATTSVWESLAKAGHEELTREELAAALAVAGIEAGAVR